jgi:hypothetical protein
MALEKVLQCFERAIAVPESHVSYTWDERQFRAGHQLS